MAEFCIESDDFKEGEEIPKQFGYKHGNEKPKLIFEDIPENSKSLALIMDDPDAMGAVGKVWVHWIFYDGIKEGKYTGRGAEGKTDFGEIGYGGPAPPDKRHTYIFRAYALNKKLDLQSLLKIDEDKYKNYLDQYLKVPDSPDIPSVVAARTFACTTSCTYVKSLLCSPSPNMVRFSPSLIC